MIEMDRWLARCPARLNGKSREPPSDIMILQYDEDDSIKTGLPKSAQRSKLKKRGNFLPHKTF